MEYFKQKALQYCHPPPQNMAQVCGLTLGLSKGKKYKQNFLQHIDSVDPAIRFTVEDNKDDRAITFLDTIVKPEANGKLYITVYRKPTHTELILSAVG